MGMMRADENGNTPTTKQDIVVLLVEDTQELAEVILATLEHMELTAHHESHGKKALEAFDRLQPDLLLLDLGLPDMQGWKVLDTIKERAQKDPDIQLPKVIVISAYSDPANRLMGKLQSVATYLIKPFTPDEVEQVVGIALGLIEPPEPSEDDSSETDE